MHKKAHTFDGFEIIVSIANNELHLDRLSGGLESLIQPEHQRTQFLRRLEYVPQF